MKNLLYWISLVVTIGALNACQSSSSKEHEKEGVSPDTMASSVDTLISGGDTIVADSAGITDTILLKDEKYKKDSTGKHEAPDHMSPNEAKLDSIKKAKSKKKKD